MIPLLECSPREIWLGGAPAGKNLKHTVRGVPDKCKEDLEALWTTGVCEAVTLLSSISPGPSLVWGQELPESPRATSLHFPLKS
jgi:hypothetical protein